jgi:hypothetical protein
MLVLPGPGVLAIAGGLALLGKELPWAKRINDGIAAKFERSDSPKED